MHTLISRFPKLAKRVGFCALSCFLLCVPAFAAQPTVQQTAEYEASDETSRVKLLITLSKSGQHGLAADLLQRYPLQGRHAADRTLYIEGLVLKAEGDLTGAAKKFRAALAHDPKLTLVRADLAQTLVELQQDDSATHHLELLAADAPTEQDAAGIRSFIDRIDERSPLKFSAFLSLAPSTNVNNGSGHTTVYSPVFGGDLTIDEDSRKKSGIGAAVGGSVGFTKRLGNDFLFVAAGSAEARIYDDSTFNSYTLSQSAEIRYMFERGYLGLGAVASQALDNGDFDLSYISHGPRLSSRFNLTARDRLTASTTFEWRDYASNAVSNGTAWISDVAWTHALDSSFNVTISAGFDDVEAQSAMISYETRSAGFSTYKELPWGFTINAAGEVRFTEFDALNVVAGVVREDTRLIGGLTLTKRDLNILGFAPAVNYTYVNNGSNISLYDYDSHSVDFRLTKDF